MTAEASPLLVPNLGNGHQERRQLRVESNDADASADGQQQHQQPSSSLTSLPSQMSLPRHMRRQSKSSSILPVIDEGEGGSGDDSSQTSSISSHCRLLSDSVMHHCIIWPPRGYTSWPPPSSGYDQDGICEQQMLATTSYGSLPLSKNRADSASPRLDTQEQQCRRSSSFSSHNHIPGFQTRTTTNTNTHRSLIIATLAFSLMAVATWLPVFMQEPAVEFYTTNNFSDLTHVTELREGTTKLRNASGDDDNDNFDATLKYSRNKWASSSHHAAYSAMSTLPIYRRSYDESDRGEEESRENESGDNEDNNATDITKVDNDIKETEAVDSDEQQQEDDTSSTSLPPDIKFADLASMMLPTYFQKTVRLCISTIKPSITNHTSIDEVNNVTTTTITLTTSVMPGDVFKLRKTMLKTRDMLDAFSPVYPTESSLDNYDVKKHDDAALIMHFKPWKKVGLETDKMLESNYRNSGVDTERMLRTKRRRPPPLESRSKIKDLWYTLRKSLDRGYTLIGDFQDLDHAKIMHSPDQLAQYQLQVWQWHDEFMTFVDKHRRHISLYLSLPCQTRKIAKKHQSHHHCRYVHSHSSHLFWGSVHSEHDLPDGMVDKATSVLGRLGYMQLGRAEAYLVDVFTREHVISTINETTTNVTSSTATTTSSLEDDEQGEADMDNEDDNENDVHEIYHNLRKELRSFLDELDLFGDLLLPHSSIVPEIVRDTYLSLAADQSASVPPSPSYMPPISLPASPSAAPSTTTLTLLQQTDEAADVLRSVRNMLGDLNDSYVAYAKYLEWNEYLEERLELEKKVETQWENFRVWAKEVDLIAKLNFLRSEIDPTVLEHPADVGTNLNSIQAPQSLESFLIEHKANPSNHLVLGNDAGDADSVISAITLAYIESMEHGKYVTPVVAISKYAFVHERPDIALVLELAGVHDASDKLIFIEDLEDIVGKSTSSGVSQSKMTLVDHNTLNPSLPHSIRKNLIVKEIVDHHVDEGKYQETCSGNHRIVAFRDGQPLVSSTTTLVAERLEQYRVPYPPSIGILLLGVILLDSVNLDDAIGKVTERDKIAVDDLVVNTDWSKVTMTVTFLTSDGNGDIAVDTTELFNELQLAKYDAHFWSDIPVSRALGYDVKYFHQDEFTDFGVSTILMPPTGFMKKDGFAESTLAFMGTEQISLLGIMFAFYDEEKSFRRQLAFISTDQQVNLRLLIESLLNSSPYTKVDLQLEEMVVPVEFDTEFDILLFDQRDVTPSRKEIGPMIEDFFHIMLDGSN